MESCARAELLADSYEKQAWQQGVVDVPSSLDFELKVADDTNIVDHSLPRTSASEGVDGVPSLCAVERTVGTELDRTSTTKGIDGGPPPRSGLAVDNYDILPEICNRKFELPELSRIFLGQTWCLIFTVTACLDLYGLTWSIAAVFASSLASEVSILNDANDYVSLLLIFAAIVIPLSFVPMVSQVWIQMGFFAGRTLMVVIMLTTTAAAFAASEPHFGNQDGPQQTSPLANFRFLHV